MVNKKLCVKDEVDMTTFLKNIAGMKAYQNGSVNNTVGGHKHGCCYLHCRGVPVISERSGARARADLCTFQPVHTHTANQLMRTGRLVKSHATVGACSYYVSTRSLKPSKRC